MRQFVVKIPEGLAPEQAAPLLCVGVTVYCPLSHFGLKKSRLRGSILGLGGFEHMGVLIAKAMGHHVTVISSSEKKREESMNVLGADKYFVISETVEMQAATNSLDYLIDTVSIPHPMDDYISMLKLDGNLICWVSSRPLCNSSLLYSWRKTITGTFIGCMKEIEELLEFCNEKGVKSSIEVVKMEYINTAMERLANNDVRYRFVVDVAASQT
ncbi:hypothetical protein L6452_28125 [Arctium lappa]|uniref:Uncharacterized protein n=1 Tax=Arctium lappa TaxID=4217 RepID=A0ACB8ZXU2_ARCLA|nr:hypothetical protein L6452_28125 [Arctium lappa]